MGIFHPASKMPELSLVNFNIVCATLGGFISVFGLVSYLFKERFYLSEACLCRTLWNPALFLFQVLTGCSDLVAGRRCLLSARRQFH